MESDRHGGGMRSIGEMARASGLSVSALRFYDGAGVLVPAMVDPDTGYRWYDHRQVAPARLLAGLRRVGMPLAEITLLLSHWPNSGAVGELLDAHLRRLEDGLTDARRELARIRTLLDVEEPARPATATRLTLAGPELAAAIDAVRFAVGHDPELPILAGIRFDVDGDLLRLVATDRYRLALSAARIRSITGPPVRATAPATLLDEVRGLLAVDGSEVTVDVEQTTITVRAAGRTVRSTALPYDFPDYRRLLRDQFNGPGARRLTVDADALRGTLRSGQTPVVVRDRDGIACDVAVLSVDRNGDLAFLGDAAVDAGADHIGVNREFLLEALGAGGPGQLVLELDGPVRPLAIRVPGDEHTFSVLMPVRLT